MLSDKVKSWSAGYSQRATYSTMDRRRYYEIAARYVPASAEAIIVDIGSGDGGFVDHLKLTARNDRTYLLDANPETVRALSSRFERVLLYRAPDRLPFDDRSVSLVHSSHMVEHLGPDQLLALLREIDRVLLPGGVMVISTPMLWAGFYSDLSHVRPYNPGVFIHYLCDPGRNRSSESISTGYTVADLVFRYLSRRDMNDGWGSRYRWLDLLIQVPKRVLDALGVYPYEKTGYTIVLRKGNAAGSV